MPRTLRDLSGEERVAVVAAIQTEAQAAGWHELNNAQKRVLYDRWTEEYDLARPAVKDGIMKAPTWRNGLMQALWYKSAYYQESGIQAIPTIVLFGNVSGQRWDEIRTTCLDQRAQALGHGLFIDGREPQHRLAALLTSPSV